MNKEYDLVIFDLDGVLLDSSYNGFEWALEARQKVIEENGWETDLDGFEDGIFEPNQSENLEKFLKEKDLTWNQLRKLEEKVAERKIEMARKGKIRLFNNARDILEKIKTEKAVVSNAYGGHLDKILEVLGIRKYFGYVTGPELSDIENYRDKMKPDSRMLEKCLEETSAENAIMIGDQVEDVIAAGKTGLESIQVNRDGEEISRADYEVQELSEIPEIVQD